MGFREIQSITFYDADISDNSTLLVSSKNGLLSIFYNPESQKSKERIAFDMQSKKIKFYPGDDSLFTSSDEEGLRVWDREKQKIIFTYPKDIIIDHVYLENRNIAAVTEIGIKFFDLRMRYASTFYQQKNIKKISSLNSELTFCTENHVFRYHNNKSDIIYKSEQEIIDYSRNSVLKKDSIYFIDLEIEKEHIASKIVPIHSKYQNRDIVISTIYNNQINFIEMNNEHTKTLQTSKKIDYAISDHKDLYVFVDNKLYVFD